jgi:putative transposase
MATVDQIPSLSRDPDYVLDLSASAPAGPQLAFGAPPQLLKGLTHVPRVVITDRLASHGTAKREVLPSVEPRQHRYLNHRAGNSRQPTRQRERRMQRFKSPGQAQRFLAAYGPIAQHFRPRRHLFSAPKYRQEMRQRFQTWWEITGLAPAA